MYGISIQRAGSFSNGPSSVTGPPERRHYVRCCDGNASHYRQVEPVGSRGWETMRTVENSLPAFLYPQRNVAFEITPFFWAIEQPESVLASFDNSHSRAVKGVHGVTLCRDTIAVNLTLLPVRVKIDLFHNIKDRAGNKFFVVWV